jgi:hypothetical protein
VLKNQIISTVPSTHTTKGSMPASGLSRTSVVRKSWTLKEGETVPLFTRAYFDASYRITESEKKLTK